MALYYFDLHEHGSVIEDACGMDQPSMADALGEALRAAREIMCAELADGRLSLAAFIEVKDAARDTVLTVPFQDAVTINFA